MPHDIIQSAISEVKDQLALDYADDKYLNVVSGNLGIARPVFGFTDSLWRAVVKELAIEHKQIRKKFRDIMAIMFGPAKTWGGTLKTAASIGDEEVVLNRSTGDNGGHLPQVGTLVFDKGTASEETIGYHFIDRRTNTVYLDEPLAFNHAAVTEDAEQPLVADIAIGAVSLTVPFSHYLPTSGFPVVAVLSRGLPNEETVTITSNNLATGVVGISATVNEHYGMTPTVIRTTLTADYTADSMYISLADSKKFPSSGYVLLNGVTAEYTSHDFDGGTLQLRKPLTGSHVAGDTVELLEANSTITVAPVQALGTGWDVIQVEPRNVELYFPAEIQDEANLRSASYMHEEFWSITGVTVDANATAGDVELTLNTIEELQAAGTLLIDSGGPNEERVGYGLKWTSAIISSVTSVNAYGNTLQSRIVIPGPLPVGGLQDRSVFINGYGFRVYDNTATDIDLMDQLPNSVLNDIVAGTTQVFFFDPQVVLIPHGLANNHSIGETVDPYNPTYPLSATVDGDLYNTPDVFPGPYLYDNESAVCASGPTTTLNQTLAKATTVVLERNVGDTAIEVDDATTFPLSGFPYTAFVGRGTGNREVVNINAVHLAQRVGNTLLLAANTPASPSLPTTLTVSLPGVLPNAGPYRILVGRGVNEEVLLVTATSGTTVFIESSTLLHSIGETVELLADVLTVDSLNDDHRGYVTNLYRKSRWPTIIDYDRQQAELVEVRYDSVAVVSTASFPAEGEAVLNFGGQRMSSRSTVASTASAGAGSVTLVDSSEFPTTYDYKVILGVGKYTQEIVTVTNNNTGTGVLTLSHPLKFTHDVGEQVQFVTGQQEVLEYTSVVGNTIRFSTPIVVNSDHHPGEDVRISLTSSVPRSLGYDFPLRMPPDILFRIRFLLDLIRAAGVQYSVIYKR